MADGGVFVEDLSEHIVRSKSDVYALLQAGKQQRTTNSTKMNRVCLFRAAHCVTAARRAVAATPCSPSSLSAAAAAL